jgi:GlcNAc-P-P-Und epimerase
MALISYCNRNAGDFLILGGSGFIGTRLTQQLVSRGAAVRIGDLQQSREFGNLWSHCDVRDCASVMAAARGAKAIFNLAAEHRDDIRPFSRYAETNVHGAKNVCEAARASEIRSILFTSSVAVYGFQPHAVDERGPFAPFNEYGKTKLEAERVYQQWAAEDSARTLIVVRPSVVFGESNRGNVYNLLRQVASGRFLMVGGGKNIKSISYVGNVTAFLIHALSFGPGVHVFNYSDAPDMNTRELVSHVREYLGKSGRVRSLPMPVALSCGHVLDAIARVSGRTFPVSAIRIKKFCASTQVSANKAAQSGFVPPYSLLEGLQRTVQYEFLRKATEIVMPARVENEAEVRRPGAA